MKIKNYKKHSKEEYDLAVNFRKKYGWGAKRIHKYLLENNGIIIKKGAIEGWLNKGNEPFEEKIIKPIPHSAKELTKEKAYILGTLCGDGWVSTGYRLGLEACDKEFVDYFQECLEKVYNRIGNRTERIRIKEIHYILVLVSKKVVKDLQRYSKSFKGKEWIVPEQIKKAPKAIKAAFISAFADSEGSMRYRKGSGELTIHSGNKRSLQDVRKMLFCDFKIKSTFLFDRPTVYTIHIYDYNSLKKFHDEIGFKIHRKQIALKRTVESYKRKGLRRYSNEFKTKALNMLQNGMKHREIAKLLGTSYSNIYDWEKQNSKI